MADRLVASFVKTHAPTVRISADFELDGGDDRVTVLFGPSGAGKTTILRCLAGLDQPESGFIRFGTDVWFDRASGVHRPPQERRLAYVPQDYSLFPHLTVEDNIRFGMDKGLASANVRVEAILKRVELSGKGRRYPRELSGGEQQRVALARVLARNPRLVLLDEPLAALDLPLREPLRRELRQFLRAIDVPSVVVTHDCVDALTLGDKMAVIAEGRVRQVGLVHEVFSRPADVVVATSVGVETVVPGEIAYNRDGIAIVRVGSTTIAAAETPNGARSVFVCIRAEDVTLESAAQQTVSARNQLAGHVVDLTPEGAVVRVRIDCGFSLTAAITRAACEHLRLVEGAAVVAAIKATAIHLISRDDAAR